MTRWEKIAFAILLYASLLPIWWVRYPPLPDAALHLAEASIWQHLDDPSYHYAEYFKLSLHVTPYWGYFVLMRIFGVLFGVGAAHRIVLSIYAVAMTLGTLALARRFGRDPRLALFSFACLWSFCFNLGFINNALAFALVFGFVALFDRFCERPSLLLGIATVLAGVWIFFTHFLGWGLACGCAGMVGLLHEGRSLKRMLGRAAVFTAIVAVGIAVTRYGGGRATAESVRQIEVLHRHPFWPLVRDLPKLVWNQCAHIRAIGIAVLAIWVVLRVSAGFPRPRAHELRAEACFLVAAGAYFFLPRSVIKPSYCWGVEFRFGVTVLGFLWLCVPRAIEGWRRWLLVPVAAGALAMGVDTALHWRRADQFVAGFDEIAAIPKAQDRVLFIVRQPWRDPSYEINYVSSQAYYLALHGGYGESIFDDGFPITFKKKYPSADWRAPVFNWDELARYYDYVAAFQSPNAMAGHEEARLVLARGKWKLWKLPGPRSD